jgi:hypothetical protein
LFQGLVLHPCVLHIRMHPEGPVNIPLNMSAKKAFKSSNIRFKSNKTHLSVQQWSLNMTTLLPPQANKMEEEVANHKGKGEGDTLQPTLPTNKGMITALGNHVFDHGEGKVLISLTRIGRSYSHTLASTTVKTCMLNSLQEKAFPYLFPITHLR